MDWFLYDNGLRHERVKGFFTYLFIYTLFKVDLHITLQQKPINVNYQN